MGCDNCGSRVSQDFSESQSLVWKISNNCMGEEAYTCLTELNRLKSSSDLANKIRTTLILGIKAIKICLAIYSNF